jgi:hypothetical protein
MMVRAGKSHSPNKVRDRPHEKRQPGDVLPHELAGQALGVGGVHGQVGRMNRRRPLMA